MAKTSLNKANSQHCSLANIYEAYLNRQHQNCLHSDEEPPLGKHVRCSRNQKSLWLGQGGDSLAERSTSTGGRGNDWPPAFATGHVDTDDMSRWYQSIQSAAKKTQHTHIKGNTKEKLNMSVYKERKTTHTHTHTHTRTHTHKAGNFFIL